MAIVAATLHLYGRWQQLDRLGSQGCRKVRKSRGWVSSICRRILNGTDFASISAKICPLFPTVLHTMAGLVFVTCVSILKVTDFVEFVNNQFFCPLSLSLRKLIKCRLFNVRHGSYKWIIYTTISISPSVRLSVCVRVRLRPSEKTS